MVSESTYIKLLLSGDDCYSRVQDHVTLSMLLESQIRRQVWTSDPWSAAPLGPPISTQGLGKGQEACAQNCSKLRL